MYKIRVGIWNKEHTERLPDLCTDPTEERSYLVADAWRQVSFALGR